MKATDHTDFRAAPCGPVHLAGPRFEPEPVTVSAIRDGVTGALVTVNGRLEAYPTDPQAEATAQRWNEMCADERFTAERTSAYAIRDHHTGRLMTTDARLRVYDTQASATAEAHRCNRLNAGIRMLRRIA